MQWWPFFVAFQESGVRGDPPARDLEDETRVQKAYYTVYRGGSIIETQTPSPMSTRPKPLQISSPSLNNLASVLLRTQIEDFCTVKFCWCLGRERNGHAGAAEAWPNFPWCHGALENHNLLD